MAEVFATEWVLSSWPWRLGSILYDPVVQMDVQAWDLQDLAERPGLVTAPPTMLDPRRDYQERAGELSCYAAADQELLCALYEINPEVQAQVQPKVSQMVPQELEEWLKPYGLEWKDLALDNLQGLLVQLESWSMERHHEFLADWWETWEVPHQTDRPSIFRQDAGPGGSVYRGVYGEDALLAWQEEQTSLGLSDFSLWAALRSHWGWRLEFGDQPRPNFKALDQLHQLFD